MSLDETSFVKCVVDGVLEHRVPLPVFGAVITDFLAVTPGSYSDEEAADAIADALIEGAGISISYDDGLNEITITCTITQYTDGMADARAAAAIATHEAAPDPHPGYLTTAEGNAAYSAIGHDHDADYEPLGAIATHVGLADPHTQYLKESDFNLSTFTTADLVEGANLYYTNERVDDRINALLVEGAGIDFAYDDGANTFTVTVDLSELSTTTLPEGTNLYYTNERAQDAIGGILSDAGDVVFTYDDGTPAISAVVKNDAISYAKMQNVSAISKLLGRGSAAGAGDVEEITLGTNLSMSGTTLNASGGGTTVAVEDEGVELTAAVTRLDFAGAGVTATEPASDEVLVTIPGLSILRGYIWGLTLSNAADAANDITVAAGEATAESHDELMTLSAPITKRLDAGWAVGDAQGGLNTGAEANSTWYEVHLIKRTDTGVVDVMFTTTANRATLPTNYTKQRRIGWIRNDSGGAILAFTQVDDHFTLTTPQNDVSATSSASANSRTVTAPPNSLARMRAACLGNTGVNAANAVVFSELVETDTAPTTTNGFNSIGAGDFAIIGAAHIELRVNSSSQIRDRSITATGTMAYDISTYGWVDNRRRLSAT